MKNTKLNHTNTTQEISQIVVGGIEEILGEQDLHKLLNENEIAFEFDTKKGTYLKRAFSYAEIKKLECSLVELFGEAGCRGAAIRSGRSFFQGLYRQFGIQMGLNSLEFRMLSPKKRILCGLEKISDLISESTQLEIKINDDDQKWYWSLSNKTHPNEIEVCHNPISDFSIGLLQGYLAWASGGKSYPIQKNEENRLPFTIEIGKKAIG